MNPTIPKLTELDGNSNKSNLHDLLTLNNQELERLDIAYVNLICASGLPGTQDIDIDTHLEILNRAAEQVEYNLNTIPSVVRGF